MIFGIDGNAPSIASPAGFISISSFAIAHLKTVRIRWRTRLAVSGRVDQMGVRTVNTSVRPIDAIGLLPIFGKACRSRVCIHERACLSLRQRGLLTSWTARAALLNVSSAGLRFSSTGSFPSAIDARLSAARFLAWASEYSRIPSQADIAPTAVDGYALHPALAARLAYEQVQAVAVGVAAGVPERLHPCRR